MTAVLARLMALAALPDLQKVIFRFPAKPLLLSPPASESEMAQFEPGKSYPIETLPDDLHADIPAGQKWAIQQELKKMSTESDKLAAAVATLTGNVSTLTANVAAHDTAIQAELVALQAAIASGDTAAIDASIANIAAASTGVASSASTVATETAALTASLPAAPAA